MQRECTGTAGGAGPIEVRDLSTTPSPGRLHPRHAARAADDSERALINPDAPFHCTKVTYLPGTSLSNALGAAF